MIFKGPRMVAFEFIENDKIIFSLAWNSMLTDYWKVLVYRKCGLFLSQKVDGKIIFTDY